MLSSGREMCACDEHWRKLKKVMVESKKQAKEIVSSISWAAWKKKLEVNQKDSQLRTFCHSATCRFFVKNCAAECGRYSWFAIVLVLILHIRFAFLSDLYSGHSYFPKASIQRVPIHEYGIMGFLCFSVWFFRIACYWPQGEGIWCSVQFRNRICSGALYVRWGGCLRFDTCSHGNAVKFVASLCFVLSN